MKLLTRRVSASKSSEEIMHIMKNSSCPGEATTFTESTFSICCIKRRNHRYRAVVPVRGYITDAQNGEVRLEIHAGPIDNLYMIFGSIFVCFVIGAVCRFIFTGGPIWTALILLSIGTLVFAQPFWNGIEILDLLEHKLTRNP